MMDPELCKQSAGTQLSKGLMYSNVVPLTDFNVADVKGRKRADKTNEPMLCRSEGIDKGCYKSKYIFLDQDLQFYCLTSE